MSDDFRVVGVAPLLHSHVFDVERLTLEHQGASFERDVARHAGAVAILARNEKGEIGVLRQYRASVDRVTLEIPAGTRDVQGETPLETAKRELAEELGAHAASWRQLVTMMVSPGWTDQLMYVFEATDLSFVATRPDGPEESVAVIEWYSPERLREVMAREPAVDATMTAALNGVYGSLFD